MILKQSLRSTRLLPSQFRIMSTNSKIKFGPFEVTDQVFYRTEKSYALVNIKPILPGHVLVVPFRPVQLLTDLSPDEVTDLFTTVQMVLRMLAKNLFYSSGSGAGRQGGFNIAIQDGEEAGQTVPHVHCHIIPRPKEKEGVKGVGDKIYDRLHGDEGNVGGGLWDLERPSGERGRFPKIEEKDRKPRSVEVMNEEANFYAEQMALVDEKCVSGL